MNLLPCRRRFGRLLILLGLAATIGFAIIPNHPSNSVNVVRTFLGTVGTSVAFLWAPAFLYAGLRTRCWGDAYAGAAGLLTLVYWIPTMVYS